MNNELVKTEITKKNFVKQEYTCFDFLLLKKINISDYDKDITIIYISNPLTWVGSSTTIQKYLNKAISECLPEHTIFLIKKMLLDPSNSKKSFAQVLKTYFYNNFTRAKPQIALEALKEEYSFFEIKVISHKYGVDTSCGFINKIQFKYIKDFY